MNPMSATLDVSQRSGWLNASAVCRVEREYGKRGGIRGRAKVRAWGRRRRKQCVQEDPQLRRLCWQGTAERTLNMYPMVVTLEVSQLSG